MKTRTFPALAVLLTLGAGTLSAQTMTTMPATQPATMPATMPASGPATQPAAFAATDKDAILKAVGSPAIITGKVSRTNAIPAITFINFVGTKRGDFTVIIKAANLDAVNKAFNGDVEAAVKDKTIAVTGAVSKYHETPQIEITKPDQLTILPDSPAAASQPAASQP